MAGFTHLFIPGPTNIPEAVRQAMNMPMEDMRAPSFPQFTLPLFDDVKKVFKNETGRVFIYPVVRHRRLGSRRSPTRSAPATAC